MAATVVTSPFLLATLLLSLSGALYVKSIRSLQITHNQWGLWPGRNQPLSPSVL